MTLVALTSKTSKAKYPGQQGDFEKIIKICFPNLKNTFFLLGLLVVVMFPSLHTK
jgi:hypothetical protein